MRRPCLHASVALSVLEAGGSRDHICGNGFERYDAAVVRKALKSAAVFAQAHHTSFYYPSYSAQSGEIVGILKQLQEEMQADLGEAQKAEAARSEAFEELRSAKTMEIEAGEKMEEQKEDELATATNSLAEAKEDLAQEEASLSENQKFLDNMKATCETADKNFEERKKLRMQEIEAVAQTIQILTEDDARDAMTGTYSFIQQAKEVDVNRRRAADRLREVAKKVKKAIDDMIATLKTQQADEVKKVDWCKAELQQNEMTSAKTEDRKSDMQAKASELESNVHTLEEGILEAQKQISQAQVELQSASLERKYANMDFQRTVGDQMVTVEVLKKAVTRLSKYYDQAALLQSRGRSGEEPAPGSVAPVAQMEYKPSAGAAGVMQMLEKLISEAKELMAESKRSESEAQKAYEQTIRDTNGAVAALQKEVAGVAEGSYRLHIIAPPAVSGAHAMPSSMGSSRSSDDAAADHSRSGRSGGLSQPPRRRRRQRGHRDDGGQIARSERPRGTARGSAPGARAAAAAATMDAMEQQDLMARLDTAPTFPCQASQPAAGAGAGAAAAAAPSEDVLQRADPWQASGSLPARPGGTNPWGGQIPSQEDFDKQMQSMFDKQLDEATSRFQEVCTTTLKKAQDDFQSSMRLCFQQVRQVNTRIDQQSHTVADIQKRQVAQEKEQDRIRDTVARLERTIALAETTASSFDTARLANWERQAEPTLFTVGAPSAIAPQEIRRAIHSWVTESGLTMDQVELDGQVPSRKFFTRTTGVTTEGLLAAALAAIFVFLCFVSGFVSGCYCATVSGTVFYSFRQFTTFSVVHQTPAASSQDPFEVGASGTQWVIGTPDNDVYLEDFRHHNQDIPGFRLSGPGGALPGSIDPAEAYRFRAPPGGAALARLQAEAKLVAESEAVRLGGVPPGDVPDFKRKFKIDEEVDDTDARVLPVTLEGRLRHRDYGEAVDKLDEGTFEGLPGRTAALEHDQLDVPDLISMEYAMRRAQLVEYYHRERTRQEMTSKSGDVKGPDNEGHLVFMGPGDSREVSAVAALPGAEEAAAGSWVPRSPLSRAVRRRNLRRLHREGKVAAAARTPWELEFGSEAGLRTGSLDELADAEGLKFPHRCAAQLGAPPAKRVGISRISGAAVDPDDFVCPRFRAILMGWQEHAQGAPDQEGCGDGTSGEVTTTYEAAVARLVEQQQIVELDRLVMKTGELDKSLAKHLDYLYFEGESAAAGQLLVAAAKWRCPTFGRCGDEPLPLASQALRGFGKMPPPRSRLPIPAVVVAGLAMVAVSRCEPFASLGALLAFHLYLGPTGLKQMRWRHWSQPVGVALGGAAGRRLALHPNEEGVVSKVGELDENISIDATGPLAFLNRVMALFHRDVTLRRELGQPVVKVIGKGSYHVLFRQAAEFLKLDPAPVPRQLRHAGPSFDVVQKLRALAEVKARGRWVVYSSVRRSNK
ncbi:unnamed protein product [Prorocentrum cordatum]|uniref:Uncharacterized protein n=1 Tax=Prorocentrum cordatum TaxID=2364126 RepID=A0ABN9TGT7_9DINO|nr:unnamed protein product [Polarella glacialis]